MYTKTYTFKEFMNKEHKKVVKPPTTELIPLALTPFIPMKTFAATDNLDQKVMTAFTPIIDLLQAMAYPIAMIVVLGGAVFVMIGNSEKGFSMMQKAGMGYALVMMLPMILSVLAEAMRSVV